MAPNETERLVSKAKEYLWPPFGRDASFFGSPVSIVKSGEGRHIVDIFGNRLLETYSCGGACPLGFNVPEIMEAVIDQMKRLANAAPNLYAPAEPLIWFAEKIASLSPGSLGYTIFGCSGTDANDTAIKIARHYWKILGKGTKYKVISRYPRGYHGMSLSAASASGHSFRRVPYEPLMAGFVHIHAPVCYRCPFNSSCPECGLLCAQELRSIVEFEDPTTVACFIGEQTLGGGGIIPPPPGYMQAIREICDKYEILLIVDEVATALGKTGNWFECEQQGIVPDMITMGKGLSWGTGPLSATHVKAEIAEVFRGRNALQQGFTFGGMGYLAAAGLAGIDYVEKHGLLKRVQGIGARLSEELGSMKDHSSVIGDVRVNSSLAGVELVEDRATKEIFPDRAAVANLVAQVGRDNGVLLNCSTRYGDIIQLEIQFTMTDEELDQVLDAVNKAVREVEEHFL